MGNPQIGNLDTLIDFRALVNKMTRQELDTAWDILKERSRLLRDRANMNVMENLQIGALVSFLGRRGLVVKGYVHKIGRTRAHVVAMDGMRWSVSPSLLTVYGIPDLKKTKELLNKLKFENAWNKDGHYEETPRGAA